LNKKTKTTGFGPLCHIY